MAHTFNTNINRQVTGEHVRVGYDHPYLTATHFNVWAKTDWAGAISPHDVRSGGAASAPLGNMGLDIEVPRQQKAGTTPKELGKTAQAPAIGQTDNMQRYLAAASMGG